MMSSGRPLPGTRGVERSEGAGAMMGGCYGAVVEGCTPSRLGPAFAKVHRVFPTRYFTSRIRGLL